MCFQRICRAPTATGAAAFPGRLPHTRSPFPRCTRLRTENPAARCSRQQSAAGGSAGNCGSPSPGREARQTCGVLARGAELFGRHAGAWPQAVRPHAGALQSLASAAAAVKRYQRLPEAESSSCSSGSAAEGGCGAGSLSKSSPRSSLSACCRNQSSRMRQDAAAV